MLEKCPECELLVSDKALACPHCGFPLMREISVKAVRKQNRRRRLPNGFGQISELKGRNLKKPFRAMVTIGKDPEGRPICKLLKPVAYFATYNEAYSALMDYNKNPFDLSESITLQQLYEKWYPVGTKSLKPVSIRNITSAWQYCHPLYDCEIRSLRSKNIRLLLEHPAKEIGGELREASASSISRMKSLLNALFQYAADMELVERNFISDVRLDPEVAKELAITKTEHIAFADDEMKQLWAASKENDIAKMVIVQCYMGWRPQELASLSVTNVNITDWTVTGGMKTAAGADRIVPVHTRIRPFMRYWLETAEKCGSNWLFPRSDDKNRHITYGQYSYRYQCLITELGLNPAHRAHDPRKHFVTMAKKYNIDEYALKHFVGHKISDLTEAVYTQRDLSWYHTEIEKLK